MSHSNRAAPPDVICYTDLKLALLPLLNCGEENLDLFNIVLKQSSEISSITEPKKGSELLLEFLRENADLLFDALFSISVETVGVLKKENRQLVCPAYLNLVSAKELNKL